MNNREVKNASFLRLALVFYGLMALIGIGWYRLAAGDWPLHLTPINQRPQPWLEIGLLAGAFLFNLLFDTAGPRYSKMLARFHHTFAEVLGSLGFREIILLALLSSLGEEILFRGAVQPLLGFVPAAILFALSHFPLKRDMWIWPIYALGMGVVLGLLRNAGGDIWSAVLLHFSVNAVSLSLISGKKADKPLNEDNSDGPGHRQLHHDGHQGSAEHSQGGF